MASTRVVVVEWVVLLNGGMPTSPDTRPQQFTDLTLSIHECMTANNNTQNISKSENIAQEAASHNFLKEKEHKNWV